MERKIKRKRNAADSFLLLSMKYHVCYCWDERCYLGSKNRSEVTSIKLNHSRAVKISSNLLKLVQKCGSTKAHISKQHRMFEISFRWLMISNRYAWRRASFFHIAPCKSYFEVLNNMGSHFFFNIKTITYLLAFYYFQITFATFSEIYFTNLIFFLLSENVEKLINGRVLIRSGKF